MDRLVSEVVVTAQQMRDIEGRIFAAGMPVAALMEKVAGLIARRINEGEWGVGSGEWGNSHTPIRVGILAGPGHNGGDALVVARELYFRGYQVFIFSPFTKLKELTAQHLEYDRSLGISCYDSIDSFPECDLYIDGLFGFGLERNLTDPIAAAIDKINQFSKPIISIDLPSGLHTDTGEVLGIAIRANHTLCLGLWKQGLLQDHALEYIGNAELIDFDIPWADIQAVLENSPKTHRVTRKMALSTLPLPRPYVTHKYKEGHLLLVCGSRRYAGGAILTALGARASGVGMLSVAVPESLKPLLVAQLPDALIIGCPETETGAIAKIPLPENTDLNSFNAIAVGPGLTREATPVVQQVLASTNPLVIDADGLNILAQLGTIPTLKKRQALTVLTPHTGEFTRLFPATTDTKKDRVKAVQEAARQSGAVVLLKGARTAIANEQGAVWINPESTPALARGGSGDVLTGLLSGLLTQKVTRNTALDPVEQGEIAATAAWWHAQAGILAAKSRTELGVDAFTLTHYLLQAIQ